MSGVHLLEEATFFQDFDWSSAWCRNSSPSAKCLVLSCFKPQRRRGLMVWQVSFATCQTLKAPQDTATLFPLSFCLHLPDSVKCEA